MGLTSSILKPAYGWPASVLLLALTTIIVVFFRYADRPAWPSRAPKALSGWPVVGSPGFFRKRWSFIRKHTSASASGHFSFFYGSHPIVVLSGAAARQTFFTNRALDLGKGYDALFSATPSIEHMYHGPGSISEHFTALFKRFLHRDRIETNLVNFVNDSIETFREMDTRAPFDPFGLIYRLVYRLTHRTLGSNEVADSSALLDETLSCFATMSDSSGLEVLFPKMPIPSRLRKMWAGTKLHNIFSKIMKDRRDTGRIENDAMQSMMDEGDDEVIITAFIITALFAGFTNSGVNASWILLHLGKNREWYQKIRDEVDASIAKHRYSDQESRADVLSRLTMTEWELEFPLIYLCLRECVRLTLPGVFIRKNTSGKDVKIDNSDEIIPKDNFAVYALADIHLNPEIYPDPHTWNPARYLSDRAEDGKIYQPYIGWGAGLHPCLGMKYAKLEISIVIAMFFAHFDFDLVDRQGKEGSVQLPPLNLNNITSKRQSGYAWLRCRRRV